MKYATIRIICGDGVDEIKIEENLFHEAEKVLKAQGLTMEEAIGLFIKHCVEHGVPFIEEEIQAYKDELAPSNMLMPPTIELMRHVSSEYLVSHLEEALKLCEEENIICIDEDGKPRFVLMTIEAYEEWLGEKIEVPVGGRNE